MLPTTLTRDEWTTRAREHATAVDELTAGHRERRARGERHPVEDFLFEYYGHRPAQLRRWHPGLGVALAEAPEYAAWSGYVVDDDGIDVAVLRQIKEVERARIAEYAAWTSSIVGAWYQNITSASARRAETS